MSAAGNALDMMIFGQEMAQDFSWAVSAYKGERGRQYGSICNNRFAWKI
jgi:hypothetical protein